MEAAEITDVGQKLGAGPVVHVREAAHQLGIVLELGMPIDRVVDIGFEVPDLLLQRAWGRRRSRRQACGVFEGGATRRAIGTTRASTASRRVPWARSLVSPLVTRSRGV